MSETENNSPVIYGKNAIEFVTVAAETCLFLENATEFDKNEFLNRALKILPLMYLKASMLEDVEQILDEELEDFISEEEYESLRQQIAGLLAYSDRYLEVFTKDIQLSETGIASDISEDLADIYQDLKNFLMRYQIGNEEIMNDALAICVMSFREYWGQRLVNCMRALHNALYNPDEELEEIEGLEEDLEDISADNIKNNFLSHQHGDDHDDLLNKMNI